MLLVLARSKATKRLIKYYVYALESFVALAKTTPNLSFCWPQLRSYSDVSEEPNRTDAADDHVGDRRKIKRNLEGKTKYRNRNGFAAISLRWEFRIGNVNTICMEEPILHVLGFTKLHLRKFRRMPSTWSLDLDRTLADFSFMPVFAKYIFHKSSDIACHASLLILWWRLAILGRRILQSRIFVLTLIKPDLCQSLFQNLFERPWLTRELQQRRVPQPGICCGLYIAPVSISRAFDLSQCRAIVPA
jgi:hypothetical protein